MISFSPTTKFTMQKIKYHVSRGAYFWTNFQIKGLDRAEKKVEELKKIYDLELSTKIRTDRLNSGKPVATLIVYHDLFESGLWHFYLLVKTPRTREHHRLVGIPTKTGVQQGLSWTQEELNQELDLIYKYFQDKQDFKFILRQPHIQVKITHYTMELVRFNHEIRSISEKNKNFKVPKKNFGWTWRYSTQDMGKIQEELKKSINKYISDTKKEVAIADIKKMLRHFEVWAMDRGARTQAGQQLATAKKLLKTKTNGKTNWTKECLPEMTLYAEKQFKTYATTFNEYWRRRDFYETAGYELPREFFKLSEADFAKASSAYVLKKDQEIQELGWIEADLEDFGEVRGE